MLPVIEFTHYANLRRELMPAFLGTCPLCLLSSKYSASYFPEAEFNNTDRCSCTDLLTIFYRQRKARNIVRARRSEQVCRCPGCSLSKPTLLYRILFRDIG